MAEKYSMPVGYVATQTSEELLSNGFEIKYKQGW